ncbi:MAG: hypothetical protein V1493_02445 [Candidatus Diapherotrites archaeon]
MPEKKCHPNEKSPEMNEDLARMLCRALESGGMILPDNCLAFQGRK